MDFGRYWGFLDRYWFYVEQAGLEAWRLVRLHRRAQRSSLAWLTPEVMLRDPVQPRGRHSLSPELTHYLESGHGVGYGLLTDGRFLWYDWLMKAPTRSEDWLRARLGVGAECPDRVEDVGCLELDRWDWEALGIAGPVEFGVDRPLLPSEVREPDEILIRWDAALEIPITGYAFMELLRVLRLMLLRPDERYVGRLIAFFESARFRVTGSQASRALFELTGVLQAEVMAGPIWVLFGQIAAEENMRDTRYWRSHVRAVWALGEIGSAEALRYRAEIVAQMPKTEEWAEQFGRRRGAFDGLARGR